MTRPLVLGINAAYHESAAALVRGAQIISAVEEERLSRQKHGKRARVDNPDELPWLAIDEVLRQASVEARDLDAVTYSLVPSRRQLLVGIDPPSALDPVQGWGTEEGETRFEAALRRVPAIVAERLGVDTSRFHFVPHHLSHAASVFYTSPFEEAAVLVLDGIGEDSTGWLGVGRGARLKQLESISYPNSLGLLWERFALYLGFDEYDAAKVMGLAAYGDPNRFLEPMSTVLEAASDLVPDQPFRVNPQVARLRAPDVSGLENLFGPRRLPDEPPVTPRFCAVASALQRQTERVILAVARKLAAISGSKNLCYAGGVALNCIANVSLEREGLFRRLIMINAAHDAGTAIGAALEVSLRLEPHQRLMDERGQRADLGPCITDSEIQQALKSAGLSYEYVENPASVAADALARSEIIGWVQGRLEFGPRALGRRSILADPRNGCVVTKLNTIIKNREPFRPFGASVLIEALPDWFDLPENGCCADGPRRLMLMAYPVASDRLSAIPAVIHTDNTCRIQVVEKLIDGIYYDLITHFYKNTGIPLVLNTSFNDSEPIVCSPADVVQTTINTGIDRLIMGNYMVKFQS